ncbi:MAG: SUMF1/EgtB/PvdO family nonheme iron enzyme [Candidatus Micrarchaeia archaeon]
MHSQLSLRRAERIRASFAAFAVLLTIHCEARSEPDHEEAGAMRPKMAAVPAAKAESRPAGGLFHGCPQGMARVERFCMDRFEAHLVEMDGGKPHPHYVRPRSIAGFKAMSEPDRFPQGYLSQIESESACRNSGKRLCTRAEWLRACMGSRKSRHPYGDSLMAGACSNSRGPHVMSLYFGGNTKGKYWAEGEFNSPIVNATPGYLAKSGSHYDCVSENGIFDLEGNLHEWVSDVAPSGMGTFASSCYSDNQLGCRYYAAVHARGYHDYSTGFRCCGEAR